MTKRFLVVFVIIVLFLLGGAYYYWHAIPSGSPQKGHLNDSIQNTPETTVIKSNSETTSVASKSAPPQQLQVAPLKGNAASIGWSTYTNKNLGFTFQYPLTWVKDGKEAEMTNRGGTITGVEINFTDTVTNTSLLVAYHLPSNGVQLYEYAVSQFNAKQGWYKTGGRQITIAGSKAIEANTFINTDGRGRALKPPMKLTVVDFMDGTQRAEFQLQFKTPAKEGETETDKFRQLLLSFKFTN